MQRKSSMQWRKTDVEKLNKQIKQFNNKIYYQRRTHPETADILPQPIKSSDKKLMIESFKENTREDFNRELKSLARFNKKDALKPITNDYGLTRTKWEINEYDNYKRVQINSDRKKQKEFLEIKPKEQMQMGTRKQNEIKDREPAFKKAQSLKEWTLSKIAIDKQVKENYAMNRYAQFKENYLKTIDSELGDAGKELYNFISRVPPEVLAKAYWDDDEVLKYGFIYEHRTAGVSRYDVADRSLNHWRNYLDLPEGSTYEDIDSEDYEE